MNEKSNSRISNRNFVFLVFIVLATIAFMAQVSNALYTIESALKNMGTLNYVESTIFLLKISITTGGVDGNIHLYNIINIPLILASAGVIYNVLLRLKVIKRRK